MAERLDTVNEVRDYYAGCNDALKEKVVEQRQTIGRIHRSKPFVDRNAVRQLAAVQTEQLSNQAMGDRNKFRLETKRLKDEMARMKADYESTTLETQVKLQMAEDKAVALEAKLTKTKAKLVKVKTKLAALRAQMP